MSTDSLSVLEAIALAKEAERRAADVYQAAARETVNPLARRLYDQLAVFEELHYSKLVDLERSLKERGAYAKYEEPSPEAEYQGEVKGIDAAQRTSAIAVINRALRIEQEAESRYVSLAEQIADPDGKAMFERLAKEEHTHYQILMGAYADLSNMASVV